MRFKISQSIQMDCQLSDATHSRRSGYNIGPFKLSISLQSIFALRTSFSV